MFYEECIYFLYCVVHHYTGVQLGSIRRVAPLTVVLVDWLARFDFVDHNFLKALLALLVGGHAHE